MSRYIDAEWLLNFFEPYPNDYQTPLGSLRACVADAPTIEIIRCGECKHWNEEDHWCNIRDSYGWDYKADDFCSYGSRSEKPNNSKERSSE